MVLNPQHRSPSSTNLLPPHRALPIARQPALQHSLRRSLQSASIHRQPRASLSFLHGDLVAADSSIPHTPQAAPRRHDQARALAQLARLALPARTRRPTALAAPRADVHWRTVANPPRSGQSLLFLQLVEVCPVKIVCLTRASRKSWIHRALCPDSNLIPKVRRKNVRTQGSS